MQVQLYTDHLIEGHEALIAQVRAVVEESLRRFSERITHVDVHLSDQKGDQKHGNANIRCMIEARLEGHQPLAVTDHASTLNQAVDGAAEKVTHLIEHTLGRLKHQSSHRNDPPLMQSSHFSQRIEDALNS